MRKNFSETYPPFEHAPSKIFASPPSWAENFKEYRFKVAPKYQPTRGAHKFWVGPGISARFLGFSTPRVNAGRSMVHNSASIGQLLMYLLLVLEARDRSLSVRFNQYKDVLSTASLKLVIVLLFRIRELPASNSWSATGQSDRVYLDFIQALQTDSGRLPQIMP